MTQESEFTMSASPREVLDVVATIQISKGDVFFPKLTLATKEGVGGIPEYYIIQHNTNRLPSPRHLIGDSGRFNHFTYTKVCFRDFNMVEQSIGAWEGIGNKYHFNPFTFIYTFVLAKYNVDLIEIGLFEV